MGWSFMPWTSAVGATIAEAEDPARDRVQVASIASGTISVAECVAAVQSTRDGAVVTFEGVVRDADGGKSVAWLHYRGHPSAERMISAVAARIAAAHDEVTIAVAHRIGDLRIGDVALACAVASPHRAAAFAACSELVDGVKAEVPIWKHQGFTDGSDEWVASIG